MKPNLNLITGDVQARIRSMILASDFKPGQRLVEEELCTMFEIGRTPVREALLLLQGEGLIVRRRGWEVQGVDHLQVHAIFESRAAIESATARLAARYITDPQLEALDGMLDAMEPTNEISRIELNKINTRFHELIVRASGNAILIQFHERTRFYYWALRVPVLFADAQLHDTNREHRELVDALRRREEDRAEHLARLHVESTMTTVEPALQR
jgi:DNA-binding GntR family transcriptional regulator